MNEKIIAALKSLDPNNADHWTAEGAPRIGALKIEGIKREDITSAAPHFSRDNPVIETPAVSADKEAKALKDAELAKKLLLTNEEKLISARLVVDERQAELMRAKRAYDEAVAVVDALTKEQEAVGSNRQSIHDIMDFIGAQQKLRLEAAEARLKRG